MDSGSVCTSKKAILNTFQNRTGCEDEDAAVHAVAILVREELGTVAGSSLFHEHVGGLSLANGGRTREKNMLENGCATRTEEKV